jgi:hypothetical protein
MYETNRERRLDSSHYIEKERERAERRNKESRTQHHWKTPECADKMRLTPPSFYASRAKAPTGYLS